MNARFSILSLDSTASVLLFILAMLVLHASSALPFIRLYHLAHFFPPLLPLNLPVVCGAFNDGGPDDQEWLNDDEW